MTSSRRNKKILMDSICGVPMAKLAEEHGLHPSRIGQICQKVLQRYGLDRSMSKQRIGARLARGHNGYHPGNTPQGFYLEVEEERRQSLWAGRMVYEADEQHGN